MAEWNGFYAVLALGLCSLFIAGSNGVPAKPENLTVTKQIPSAVHGIIANLQWDMPFSSGKRYNYYLRYHLASKVKPTQKRTRSTFARLYLKPNSAYIVKVMAIDGTNPGVQGQWSDDLKVQTGNSVPTQPPVNVTATASTTDSILVRWGPVPQEFRNGKLIGYCVFYRQWNDGLWKKKMISSPVTFQYRLTDLPIGIDYHIAIAGYTAVGVGKKSKAVDIKRPMPATASTRETTAPLSTVAAIEEATTTNYVLNHIPKSTGESKIATKGKSSPQQHIEEAITKTTDVSSRSPNAKAKKNIQGSAKSSGFVFKFIIPAAIGGLLMVVLIICILWRQRRAKRKRNQEEEAIHLTPSNDQPKKKEKSKFAVTRGEGSIRYAPPPKTYNSSTPPPPAQDGNIPADGVDKAKSVETQEPLPTISEVESTPQSEPSKAKRPYAEITIAANDDKNDRYVKRNEHKPVPDSPSKSTTNEPGYENMQHLYECLDRIKDSKGSPLYMNVGTAVQSEEVLYEEIPADREDNDNGSAVQKPLLEKDTNEQVKPEHV